MATLAHRTSFSRGALWGKSASATHVRGRTGEPPSFPEPKDSLAAEAERPHPHPHPRVALRVLPFWWKVQEGKDQSQLGGGGATPWRGVATSATGEVCGHVSCSPWPRRVSISHSVRCEHPGNRVTGPAPCSKASVLAASHPGGIRGQLELQAMGPRAARLLWPPWPPSARARAEPARPGPHHPCRARL